MKKICKLFLVDLLLILSWDVLIAQSNDILNAQKNLDAGKKYLDIKKYSAAEKNFLQVRQIYEYQKTTIKLAEVDFYLARVDYYLKKYDEGIKYAKSSQKLYSNLAQRINAQRAASVLTSLYFKKYEMAGIAAFDEKNFDLAKKNFRETFKYTSNKPNQKARIFYYLAKTFLNTNQMDSSLYFIEKTRYILSSFPEANQSNSFVRKYLKECLKLKALIYDKRHDYYRESNVLTSLMNSFSDSMTPEERRINLKNLLISYINADRLKDALLALSEFSRTDSTISGIYAGIIYERFGNSEKAIKLLQKAHKTFLLENNTQADIPCLDRLWHLQFRQRKYDDTELSLDDFLRYSEKLTPNQYLSALLAQVYIKRLKRNNVAADSLLRLFKRTLKTKSSQLDEEDREEYIINMAANYLNFGQADSAASLIEKYRNDIISFKDNHLRVEFLMISGQLENARKQYKNAIKDYTLAYEIAKANLFSKEMIKILLDMGNIYYNLGANHDALGWYKKVEKFIESNGDSVDLAVYFTNLANIYKNIQKSDSAIYYYKKSICLSKKGNIANNLVHNYYFLGQLYENKGEIKTAIEYYQMALTEIRKEYSPQSEIYSNEWNNVQRTVDVYDRLITLSYKLGRKKQGDNYRVLKYKFFSANKLLKNLEQANLSGNNLTISQKKLHQLESNTSINSSRIAEIEYQKGRLNFDRVSKEVSELLENYEQKVDKIKFQYGSQLSQYTAISPEQLGRLQNYLPQNVLLLSFFPANDQLFIFTIKKNYRNIFSVPVSRRKLYKKIRSFKKNIHSFQMVMAVRNSDTTKISLLNKRLSNFQRISLDLYSILFKPIEKIIDQNVKYILIIPSGLIYYVPFQALIYPSNGTFHYLVEKYTISYQNGNTVLNTLTRMRLNVHNYRLLALGDPDGSLPNAAEEIQAIKNEFPGASKTFLGKNATKDVLFKYSGDYNIIHFATHARLNYFNTYQSYILLAKSKKYSKKLTRNDIYSNKMKLNGVELVTLSACETGVGEKNPKSEVENIANAFLRRNVSSVVASLWSVSDVSTKELMVYFYKNIKTIPKSEALREAQLYLLKNTYYNNPYYWAAFVLIGDWR